MSGKNEEKLKEEAESRLPNYGNVQLDKVFSKADSEVENEPFVIEYSPSIPISPPEYETSEAPFTVPFIFRTILTFGIFSLTLFPARTFKLTVYCFNILSITSSTIPSTTVLS